MHDLDFAWEIYSWPEVRWLSVFHHMPKKKSFFRFAVDLLLICPSFRWATLLSVSDVEKGPIKVIEDLVWPSQHGWSIYQSLLFFFGQIHSTIWTNTFYNLNKYIFQHGQIHSTIDTNTFDQGHGMTIPTWLIHLSKSSLLLWPNTFYNLKKYILQFEQIHSTIWTNTFQHGQIHSTIETNTFDQGSGVTIPTWLVHLSKSPLLPLKAEENNPIPPNPINLTSYLIATLRYVSNSEMSTVL